MKKHLLNCDKVNSCLLLPFFLRLPFRLSLAVGKDSDQNDDSLYYGLIVRRKDKTLYKIIAAAFGCIIGLLILKTVIECALYGIPVAVKIPKNAVAMCMDFAAMTFGIILYQFILPKMRHKNV